ncbi:hypothetical protein D3C80_1382260 [compost metagenome]
MVTLRWQSIEAQQRKTHGQTEQIGWAADAGIVSQAPVGEFWKPVGQQRQTGQRQCRKAQRAAQAFAAVAPLAAEQANGEQAEQQGQRIAHALITAEQRLASLRAAAQQVVCQAVERQSEQQAE